MATLTIARLTIAEIVPAADRLGPAGADAGERAPDDVGRRPAGLDSAASHGATELEVYVAISQILILVAFMFSFVLAMTAAFLGAPAIATDLESGVAQAMLARPIRRSDLVVGRWLGLASVVVAYAFASGLLEIVAIGFVSGYYPPQPFARVRVPRRAGARAADVRAAAEHAAAGDRGRGDLRRAVRAGLDGRRVRRRRPVLRRRVRSSPRRRGEPLAAPERRSLARRDLRPRAAGGRLRDARPGRARRGGEPVLRRGAADRRRSSPGRRSGSRSCSGWRSSRCAAATSVGRGPTRCRRPVGAPTPRGYHRPMTDSSTAAPPGAHRRRRPALLARPRGRHRRRDVARQGRRRARPPDLPRLPDRRPRRARDVPGGREPALDRRVGSVAPPRRRRPIPDAGPDRAAGAAGDDEADGRAPDGRLGVGRGHRPAVAADRRAGPGADVVLAVGAGRVRPRLRAGKDPVEPDPSLDLVEGFLYQLNGRAARTPARPARSTPTSSSAPSTASTPRRSPRGSSPRPGPTSRRRSRARSGR